MFVYDDDGQTAINTDRIRVMYIDRSESPTAKTEAEHDRMDTFRLKAFMGNRVSVILTEVIGKDNVHILIERMHQITDRTA